MLLAIILLLPILGAVMNGVFLRSKNPQLSGYLATSVVFIAFLLSCYLYYTVGVDTSFKSVLFTWFASGHVYVPFSLEWTPMTGTMLLVILGIGTLIHVYATTYMEHDKSPWRFFCYLNLFVAAMLVLVLSSNLVGVFLGWEGVGLCSYLLISYWHTDPKNTQAGMKAFLTNRVGDLGFLISLFIAFAVFGTAEISNILNIASTNEGISSLWWGFFLLGLFWASTGKSAQLPLYVWLPDAMAGPTPVSALIHAATMVTSGIFLCVRLWPVIEQFPNLQELIFWVGMATAWLAALIAMTQRDMKKVLAYSTVSQLGFMFVALGAGSPVAAFFHVVTHACFKALLFLTAGSVIHGMHDKKDLFFMGNLKSKMKVSHVVYLIACLAIAGFPLTSGFFSKDLILAEVYERYSWGGYALLLGAAALTAFYMFRSYTLAFCGEARSEEAKKAHESKLGMTLPLGILAFLSLFVGWFETPKPILGIHKFSNLIESSWYSLSHAAHPAIDHHTEIWLMVIASLVSIAAALGAYFLYRNFKVENAEKKLGFFQSLSWNKFYIDEIYNALIIRPILSIGKAINYIIDEGVINTFLNGVASLFGGISFIGSLSNTGSLQSYAWYMLASLFVVLGALVLWIL